MKRTVSDLPWLRRALDGTGAAMRGMLAAAGAHGQLRGVLGSALAARGKMLRPALLLLCAGEPRQAANPARRCCARPPRWSWRTRPRLSTTT